MPLVGNRMDIWPSRLLLQRSVDPGFEEGMEVRLESWIKLALQGDLEIKIGIVYVALTLLVGHHQGHPIC